MISVFRRVQIHYQRKKNINNYIQNDLEISSDESNEEDSNEETSCEKDNQIEGWDDVSHV